MVSAETVLLQGQPVASIAEILAVKGDNIASVRDALMRIRQSIIGINTATVAKSDEITILSDKQIPFKVLKKLMSTCTNTGYTRISLAVNQKAPPFLKSSKISTRGSKKSVRRSRSSRRK